MQLELRQCGVIDAISAVINVAMNSVINEIRLSDIYYAFLAALAAHDRDAMNWTALSGLFQNNVKPGSHHSDDDSAGWSPPGCKNQLCKLDGILRVVQYNFKLGSHHSSMLLIAALA
eukprot:scaffold238589_cov12-Tisochrysis_lutea.AAC.1